MIEQDEWKLVGPDMLIGIVSIEVVPSDKTERNMMKQVREVPSQ